MIKPVPTGSVTVSHSRLSESVWKALLFWSAFLILAGALFATAK